MNKKLLTLCIVHQHPQVLLGMKKRGLGEGLWNGFGGKVEKGESIEDAAKREMQEECGITLGNIEKKGLIHFESHDSDELLEVHVFKASEFSGEPKETEEMKPEWFHADDIPFDKMWPDDEYWLPELLKGKSFKARFVFDTLEGGKITDSELNFI